MKDGVAVTMKDDAAVHVVNLVDLLTSYTIKVYLVLCFTMKDDATVHDFDFVGVLAIHKIAVEVIQTKNAGLN